MKTMFDTVDPGLGLLAWQAAVAAFLGLLFYVKKTRENVLRWLRKLFRANKAPQEGQGKISPPREAVRR